MATDWRVGDSVRWYRERQGWNQTELADAAGLSLKTVSRVENHAESKRRTLVAISAALGIDIAELEGFRPGAEQPRVATRPARTPDAVRHQLREKGFPAVIATASAGAALPLITEAQAGAGRLTYDDPASIDAFAERTFERPPSLRDPRAFAVLVKGDSMVPVFRPGHVVVVSPAMKPRSGDEVFLALKNGERVVKIAHEAENGYILESANREHAPRSVWEADVDVIFPIVLSVRREW